MIEFNFETDFYLEKQSDVILWIQEAILKEKYECGDINYIFCDDAFLLEINQKYLQHDYYTDIISFDYSENTLLSGDIFISIERVQENAKKYNVTFWEELLRVMIHGILHFCNYSDKTEEEKKIMRNKETEYIKEFSS